MAQVVLDNIFKSFPKGQEAKTQVLDATVGDSPQAVLRRIHLTVNDGEFMVLVGLSGCGKSTLLRLIAGLEELTAGNIWVGDTLVNHLPPKARDIAMVFQNYALYPHMTVYDNIAFGLRRFSTPERSHSGIPPWAESSLFGLTRSLPRPPRYRPQQERSIEQRVLKVAKLLQIEGLLERLPKQLSGGQKQRVALGRAIARNPQVFLMDEPLSNLDAKLRAETRAQIVNLQRQLGITTIYVTHDQVEAMTMGDRIAVMNEVQIQQIAPPLELYNHPANLFVAQFIGSPPMNFLPVSFTPPLLITHPSFRFSLPPHWESVLHSYGSNSLILGVRPEHLSVGVPATKNLPVQVERLEALGNETFITVRLVEERPGNSPLLQARVAPDTSVSLGEQLWLSLTTDKIHLFDPKTQMAIAPSRA
uniref:ABC transporter ATP-binding protein n=1 Tax=Desertifilum tharense IPPAS B-1220 TaxID=1781255 RepID=A0ACD5GRK7_9CYAN